MSKNRTEHDFADDVNDAVNRSVRRGVEDMKRVDRSGEGDKSVRVLGLFEVDAGTAALVDGAWNELSTRFMQVLKPRSYDLAQKAGKTMGLKGATLDRAVTAAVVGVSALATGSQYMLRVVRGHMDQYEQRADIIRKVAPVLDEIKGSHSLLAFMTVKEEPTQGGNEVLYAHRKRMSRVADVQNSNNYLRLALNVTPGVVTDFPAISKMWGGKYDPAVPAAAPVNAKEGDTNILDALKSTGSLVARGGAGPIAERIIIKNEQRLKKTLSANSGLELILTLQEQIEYDPKSRHFQLPKESGGRACGLEEYLLRICLQHQKDMAEVNHQHSEIRELLKEDLVAVIKPVAEAIRAGKLDGYSLIRLVGEHMIVKNKGRAIADIEEVRGHVEKLGNPHGYRRNETPKQFYAESAYTRDDLKKALHAADPSERTRLISMIGDATLEDAGLSKAEIKQARAAEVKHYDEHLAQGVLGLSADSDAALKQGGLSQSQIRQLRKMESAIRSDGVEAVHASHADSGIEKILLDAAVPKIAAGEASLLGTLSQRGAAVLAAQATESVAGGFTKRHGDASANESHADRAKRSPRDEGIAVNY